MSKRQAKAKTRHKRRPDDPCRTGKIAYDTHTEATKQSRRVTERKRLKKKFRAYKCPHCRKFHLTSQTDQNLHKAGGW